MVAKKPKSAKPKKSGVELKQSAEFTQEQIDAAIAEVGGECEVSIERKGDTVTLTVEPKS